MFQIQRCATKAALTVRPTKNVSLDLQKIKQVFPVTFESRIVLVIKVEGVEIVVHRHGELLFKSCEDEKKIERIARRIYDAGILR